MDTSWEVCWSGKRIVVDPWLIGSEVDYFSWFNEQWHTTDAVAPSELDPIDFILISQSYSDHCHELTLEQLDPHVPILASPKAYKRLVKSQENERLIKLPILSKEGFLDYGGFQIATIHPDRYIDPVYYAHIIAHDGVALFYSSHGFDLSEKQLQCLADYDIRAVITTFSEIKLPFFLGGKVNPGVDNANQLVEQLSPDFLINSHDEEKRSKGFVMKLAKTVYPNYDSLSFERTQYLNFKDYEYREL